MDAHGRSFRRVARGQAGPSARLPDEARRNRTSGVGCEADPDLAVGAPVKDGPGVTSPGQVATTAPGHARATIRSAASSTLPVLNRTGVARGGRTHRHRPAGDGGAQPATRAELAIASTRATVGDPCPLIMPPRRRSDATRPGRHPGAFQPLRSRVRRRRPVERAARKHSRTKLAAASVSRSCHWQSPGVAQHLEEARELAAVRHGHDRNAGRDGGDAGVHATGDEKVQA